MPRQRWRRLTSKNHVDVVLHTKPKVVLVLLGQSGKVDICVGKVDTLARRDKSVVPRPRLDVLLVHDF